jgi:hypothetical protein
MSIRTVVRLAAVASACALAGISWPGGAAASPPVGTFSTDIRVGNSGTLGGTATFVRTLQADGTEVLVAQAHLLRPSVKSSICLSHDPFIHRRSWDTCPQKIEQTSEVSYTLSLGTEYVGSVVHVQFRVRMPERPNKPDLANGYAGWHPTRHPDDQYGEVALPALTAPSPSPTPTTSPTGSPSASPTVSPSASPSASPTVSPTAAASASSAGSPTAGPTPSAASSGVAGATLGPIAVNAGSGGGAAPRPPVFLAILLVAGLALAATSGRRLARRG